jgi:hypothetical protein
VYHEYLNNSYSDTQVDTMQANNINSGAIDEFISIDELSYCRNAIKDINEWPEHGSTSKYLGASWKDPMGHRLKEIFYDKLGNLLGDDFELDFFAYQEGIKPWKVHSDIRWYDNPAKLPHHVVLVPLDVISNNPTHDGWAETYSLMFKQRNYLRNELNENTSRAGNNDQSGWNKPIDSRSSEGFTDGFSISKETHAKYMKHMPYEWMDGLELETVFRWKPGSAGHWDQNQLHCADDFLGRDIKTKLSLIFFTNF